MNKHYWQTTLTGATIGFFALGVQAMDWAEGNGQLHGFLTQGLVTSTNNNFYGDSKDKISTDFREIGVNSSYRITPGLQLSAQVISRRTGKLDDGDLALDYAFVDISLYSDEDNKFGFRVGRIKNPYGLYTDTRDVASTRPGIIVPQAIYPDAVRRLALASDGIGLYGNIKAPGGSVDILLGGGKEQINDRSTKAFLLGAAVDGSLKQDRLSSGIRALYETDNKQWRGGISYLRFHQQFTPAPTDPFPARELLITPWVFSLQYSGERWTFTGEYTLRDEKTTSVNATIGDVTANGWYLQGQYRLMPQWELLLRYESAVSDIDDPTGKQFAASTGGNALTRYARDLVIGARYDVTSDFMVRTELHHVQGAFWLSPLENPITNDLQRNWNLLMLLGSYQF